MPRVSVILPTYNDLEYLKEAIRTALDQCYDDFELIVVNDGSSDGTKEYLDELQYEKLKIVHKENGGCFDALNTGLEHADGELITWISSDNLSPNYFLDALVAGIDSLPEARFAYAAYYNINAKDQIFSTNNNNQQFPHELVSATHRGSAAFIYYKDCHKQVGPYIDSYSCDTDMWAKLSSFYPSVYIVEPLYLYRLHDKRATQKLDSNYYHKTTQQIWKGYKELVGEAQLISMLYSGAQKEKDPFGYYLAMNDIATRFMQSKQISIAMKFWQTATAEAPVGVIKMIAHNLAQASATHPEKKEQIIALFKSSVRKNNSLSTKQQEKYLKRLTDLSKMPAKTALVITLLINNG